MARRVAAYRALCEAGHGTWSGAFVDGRLRCAAGVFSAGTGLARFQNVETHPAFRRRGLASAVLLTAGEHALRDANTHTLVIVADPEDDAMRLYQALGFARTELQAQLQGTR
jgi:ribosomal protein S18 acetylase RimI-like enzyme